MEKILFPLFNFWKNKIKIDFGILKKTTKESNKMGLEESDHILFA